MSEFLTIALEQIAVGDRLRDLDEGHAQAIASSMAELGLINRITVRRTPAKNKGATPYSLVAGLHRHRGAQINGWATIDAVVVKADAREAQLIEIAENLFRNDLSVIDRAAFVQTYRDIYEAEHGPIQRGGDRRSKEQLAPLIGGGFAQHVSDRLGLSKDMVKRLDRIARHLDPALKNALRETPIADNQQTLLKLAKLEPAMQRRAAIGWRETGDIKKVFGLLTDPRPELPQSEQIFGRLVDLWSRASEDVKKRFWLHINHDIDNDEDAA